MTLPVPELLLTLSPRVLRAVVTTFGPVPGLPANASPLAIAQAVFALSSAAPAEGAPRLPPKLASFLSSRLARFGSPGGRLALVEAARALGDPRAATWLALPAADVSALLAIELATAKGAVRKRAKLLFALAGLRVDRDLPARPTYELLAQGPALRTLGAKEGATVLARAFGDRLLHLFATLDPDGALRFALFLPAPTEATLEIDLSAPTRFVPRTAVSVAIDLVRLSPDRTRATITLAAPELLPEYARALGLSLDPSFTLRPFQLLTTARLREMSVPPIAELEVVGARVRRPGGFREERRGAGVLDETNQGGGGYLDRLTVRMTAPDGKRVDAFLQTPHRFEISDRSLEAPVCAALGALGTFAPGALPDDARSLAPYEHGEWRLRGILTDAGFERMVREGRFVRVASAHVVTKEHRMHGAAYVVRDVPGEPGLQYALAEDRSLGARLVSEADRVAWRLDLEVLRRSMMRDLGAVHAQAPLKIPGLLDLGVVHLTRARLRIVYVMAEPPRDWIDAVLLACGVLTPVIFVPAGHAAGVIGMRAIELDVGEQLGAKSVGRALGRAAEALGIPGEVEAWRTCAEDVVLEVAARTLWVLGVRVHLPDHPFKLLLHLAERRGQVIATADLGLKLGVGGEPNVRARKAKALLEKHVREALEGAGSGSTLAEEMIVAEGKAGYRLGVGVRVLT
jgi:hypothetical protein